jgi:hypothetical protein
MASGVNDSGDSLRGLIISFACESMAFLQFKGHHDQIDHRSKSL